MGALLHCNVHTSLPWSQQELEPAPLQANRVKAEGSGLSAGTSRTTPAWEVA